MQYADQSLPNASTASSKTSNADGEPIPPHFQQPSKAKRNNLKGLVWIFLTICKL
jgi:hypothetical protein